MTDRYSEDEALAAVARLTRARLSSFVGARIVTPLHGPAGPQFRRIDLARMELLCELSDEFDLEVDALGIVISLLDQLHSVRGELRAVLEAVEAEPSETRVRIGERALRGRQLP